MSLLVRPVASRRPAGRVGGSPSATEAPAAAMARLPVLTFLPVAAMATLLVTALVAPAAVERASLPLAVAGVLVGVPHGAVDHLVPWWWGRPDAESRAVVTRRLAAFTLAYLALAVSAFVASVVASTPVWLAFLLLSAVHFGRGEVVTSAERRGDPVPTARQQLATTTAVGLVVVGLLLWVRPASTSLLLHPVSPWLADVVPATAGVGRWVVAASVVLALARLLRRGRRLDAVELGLVAATFALAPPLAAFGVWFGTWHALRHTGRLLDLARARLRAPATRRGWTASAALLARAGAAPTVVALLAVAALWWWRDTAGLQAEVGVLLALTFPHAAVVWALDRREARGRALSPSA